jgi:hypothetical protein
MLARKRATAPRFCGLLLAKSHMPFLGPCVYRGANAAK